MVGVKVAAFRPDDGRAAAARETLADLGVDPVLDPMLAVDPTGATPREDADVVVFTSRTGVELAAQSGWSPTGRVAAIGEATAEALATHGYPVDVVPTEFSSAGLVDALADEVAGATVEVARSDHGSDVLLAGLADAGATVHETVLYRLDRPPEAGDSTELAAAGDLAGAAFTSSLTVEHFRAAAAERGVRDAAVAGLDEAVVGCIGEPTRRTAVDAGIPVDVVPGEATFDALARAVVGRLDGV